MSIARNTDPAHDMGGNWHVENSRMPPKTRRSVGKQFTPLSGTSPVLRRFISPDKSRGRFYIGRIPKAWRPKCLSVPTWAIESRSYSSAFIAVELRAAPKFSRLIDLEYSELRLLFRPLAAWIESVAGAKIWDQIGDCHRDYAHWQFPYRIGRTVGHFDVWIFRGDGKSAKLVATINESPYRK